MSILNTNVSNLYVSIYRSIFVIYTLYMYSLRDSVEKERERERKREKERESEREKEERERERERKREKEKERERYTLLYRVFLSVYLYQLRDKRK